MRSKKKAQIWLRKGDWLYEYVLYSNNMVVVDRPQQQSRATLEYDGLQYPSGEFPLLNPRKKGKWGEG